MSAPVTHATPSGRTLRSAAASSAAVILIVVAIGAGLTVPIEESLGLLPSAGSFDYSHGGLAVSPLSAEFIAEVLGRSVPPGEAPAASAPPVTTTPPRGPAVPAAAEGAPPGGARTVADHAPTNDDVAAAYGVAAVPFTGRTSAAGATRESDEPQGCASSDATVWYRYTASETLRLTAGVTATSGSVALAVFEGDGPDDLRLVDCDSSLLSAVQVPFTATAGATYWFQVVASPGASALAFTLDPVGTTERASLAMDGGDPDSVSVWNDLSADGRYLMFESWASNLVPGDTNESVDVFVLDRETGVTERASVSSTGEGGNGNSGDAGSSISADGRYVAFHSFATNLVPDDTNGWTDVFVHDRVTRETTRVSVASNGTQGGRPPVPDSPGLREDLCREVGDREPTNALEDPWVRGSTLINTGVHCTWYRQTSISADGRYVAFETALTGLDGSTDVLAGVQGYEAGGAYHVFLHDRWTGTTTLASIGPDGEELSAWWPSLSADGRYLTFHSAGPDGDVVQVYVRNLVTATTELISVSPDGEPANDRSDWSELSADGRYVVFDSVASNLVPGDTNATWDVFVRDRVTGTTARASVSSSGTQGELQSSFGSISSDGRYVSFHSQANTFGAGLVESWNVFVHDRVAGTTTMVSVTPTGEPANDSSGFAAISDDGRHVAFGSWASNLDENDRNGGVVDVYEADHAYQLYGRDIFVHTFGPSG